MGVFVIDSVFSEVGPFASDRNDFFKSHGDASTASVRMNEFVTYLVTQNFARKGGDGLFRLNSWTRLTERFFSFGKGDLSNSIVW